MAMRETVGSMRAYLVIAGVVSAIGRLTSLTSSAPTWVTLLVIVSLILSTGFIYGGIALPQLLRTNTMVLKVIIWANMLFALLILGIVASAIGVSSSDWVITSIAVAIGAYLLSQLKRLSAEAQSASGAETKAA